MLQNEMVCSLTGVIFSLFYATNVRPLRCYEGAMIYVLRSTASRLGPEPGDKIQWAWLYCNGDFCRPVCLGATVFPVTDHTRTRSRYVWSGASDNKEPRADSQAGLLGQMSHSCHMEVSVIATFQLVNTVHVNNQLVITAANLLFFRQLKYVHNISQYV